MTALPTLYKKTSTGATQFWSVLVDGDTIVTEYGQVGGAVQTSKDVIVAGKNVGKKNETSPAQQALAEAQSQWDKKLKKGYAQNRAAAEAGETDAVITGGIFPMLAHRFDQHGDKLKYPCYVQPKLDGHRCLAVVEGGRVTLWSRTRKPILSVPHIVAELEAMGVEDGTVLDGELYNHEYRDRFEDLTSVIRASSPKENCTIVQYHVYDVAYSSLTQAARTRWIGENLNLRRGRDATHIVPVVTDTVSDEDDLMLAFNRFLSLGYEGAIARNAEGAYVNKRSHDLLKIKEFLDSEFACVGVEEGRGKLAGHAIFVCRADGGGEFRAKMTGPLDDLRRYWVDPGLAVGKQVTVKYQGLSKYGIPRFPVALRIRND